MGNEDVWNQPLVLRLVQNFRLRGVRMAARSLDHPIRI